MDEVRSHQQPRNLEDKLEYLKNSVETFRQIQTQSIKDLSNQVNILNLKMEHSTALPRAEFPKFNGQDFRGWLYKCDQFFQLFDKIPEDTKVKFASIHLEGEALRWHQKFMKTNGSEIVKWDKYIQEMEIKFDMLMGKSSAQQSQSTPSTETRKPHRRICRLLQLDDDGMEMQKLDKFHFRFGPIYYSEEHSSAKEEAWEHVLKNTPGQAAATSETYMSEMRKIETSARDSYDDAAVNFLTGSHEFRWMMIYDGCFFLQLILCILGGPQPLNYPVNHPIFGRHHTKFGDIKEWIEAIFFIGNQVPLVVLKTLIKQSFFQNVVKKGKWDEPLLLASRTLYELFLLPELLAQSPKFWKVVKGIWGKVLDQRTYWMLQQNPKDLLHGLQLLVLGPELGPTRDEEDVEDQDLEAQRDEGDSPDDKTSSSATELKETGIHFSVSHHIGSRGIHFTNSMFFFHGYAILHLPPIWVEEDTEMMLQCLKNYEISQKLSMSKREICSYIRFMSELIQMPGDAKLMASKKIIKGEPKYRNKLPGILRRLATKNTYDQNLRVVKLKIDEYSPPIWKKYWHIISFGLMLTGLQTVYTILPYYKGG